MSPARAPSTIALPLGGPVLALLLAAYLLPGLLGHDPWKTEDAVGFGVTYGMLSGGPWLAPQLAGEPFLRDGPLYYWLATLTARIASFALPLHDGARLASLACGIVAIYFTRLAARELYGKEQADLSALALLGCLGFLIHSRAVTADVAGLAAAAVSYYGLAIAWKKSGKAALLFGGASAVMLLSSGVAHMLGPVIAALAVAPIGADPGKRGYLRAVLWGTGGLVAIAVGWFALLRALHPEYSSAWWSAQTADFAVPGLASSVESLKTLAWLAWPSWPLALWAGWAFRRNLRNPGFAVPFVGSVVTLAILFATRDVRETDALALLVPLSIPAGAAAMFLRRGAANALSWFSLMTATLLGLALWVMWFAMQTGTPAQLALNVAKLEPGFEPRFEWLPFAVALLYSIAWIVFVRRAEVTTLRSLPFWSTGLTLVWALAMTLWLSWIDYGKTYRPVAQGLRAALPAKANCVASRDLGEVQRAVFHYHGGLLPQRLEAGKGQSCDWLLIQASSRDADIAPGPQWEKVWEGARPRDRERYRLYRRGGG